MTRLALTILLTSTIWSLSACIHITPDDACRAARIGSLTAAVLEWGSEEVREAVVKAWCGGTLQEKFRQG